MNLSLGSADRVRSQISVLVQDWQAKHPAAALAAVASRPAIAMTLTGTPSSPVAIRAVDALVHSVFRSDTQKKKPSTQYRKAAGAIVADLLNAARFDPFWSCKRSMDGNSFTGMMIGIDATVRALKDLEAHGLIEWYKGREGYGGRQGYLTRIVPTPMFVRTMYDAGIAPSERLDHFTYGKPPLPRCPVKLKASSYRGNDWKKIRGKSLYVGTNNLAVVSIAAPILRLNQFYQRHAMTFDTAQVYPKDLNKIPIEPPVFFRGFNRGDVEPYLWNMGGRLYPYDGHYQQLHKETRKGIMIDREETVEVDIHACYLSIVYCLLGQPFHAADDLYTIEGINRDAVKMFVNTTLSKGEPIKWWSRDHKERYNEDDLKALQRDHPLASVSRATLAAIPVITEANNKGIDWSQLIYEESEVMQATLLDLAFNHDICAYPMHDGLIISKSHIDQAENSLSSAFQLRLGIKPIIKRK